MLSKEQIDATPCPPTGIRKLSDGDNLYLALTPATPNAPGGKKGWRLKIRTPGGKESTLSFGNYPDVSPEAARDRAAAARAELRRGVNPADTKRAQTDAAHVAAVNTFGKVAADFMRNDDTVSPKTLQGYERMFRLSSKLHGRALDSITRPEIVQMCRALEQTGKRESAHRLLSFISCVFRFAANEWYTGQNPCAASFRGTLKPVIVESRAGITDPRAFGRMMLLIDGDDYSFPTVRNALRMLARVFTRPGELAAAEWREFSPLTDAEPIWRIPAARMKMRGGAMKLDHIVPLAPAVVSILTDQANVSGSGRYVFPNGRTDKRHMSDGALGAALKTLFYDASEHVPHGYRVTASTLLNSSGKFDSELIEMQQARVRRDAVAAVYDRSARLTERRAMMLEWCDMIDRFKALP